MCTPSKISIYTKVKLNNQRQAFNEGPTTWISTLEVLHEKYQGKRVQSWHYDAVDINERYVYVLLVPLVIKRDKID